MKGIIKKEITITLILNQEEAAWLRGITQNRLAAVESDQDYEIRKELFEFLSIELRD